MPYLAVIILAARMTARARDTNVSTQRTQFDTVNSCTVLLVGPLRRGRASPATTCRWRGQPRLDDLARRAATRTSITQTNTWASWSQLKAITYMVVTVDHLGQPDPVGTGSP
jgi:hypothetical protein